jgi:hypothetical protein
MTVTLEYDAKKDPRGRVVLKGAEFHVTEFDDGHIVLYPRVLVDPTISRRALAALDETMDTLARGRVSDVVEPTELLRREPAPAGRPRRSPTRRAK